MKSILITLLFLSGFAFGQDNSLLYQIKGKDKKVSYLFGTIHMIPDSLYYFPAKLDKIVSKSDEIVLEIADVSDKLKAQKLMTLESGSSFDIFTTEQKDSVLIWGAKIMGIKPEQFELMFQKTKPFFFLQLPLQKIIKDNARMYEFELQMKALSNKIHVTGLETMEDQIGFFDKIPSADLVKMVMSQIRHPEEGEKTFNEMAQYYHKQDLENLVKIIMENDDFGSSTDELLDKRNHNWIPKMEELMKTKSCFFAVGAGHLGGQNGVIQLLRQKGYEVTPIRY